MPKRTAIVLTDKAVNSQKAAPGTRIDVWDAKAPGLGLRVTDKGVKTWVVRYRTLDGRQPRLVIGTAGDNEGTLSLVKAREAAYRIRQVARDGGDPAADKAIASTMCRRSTSQRASMSAIVRAIAHV